MNEIDNKITICIKSFLRFKCLRHTVNIIRNMYPNITILVADDSNYQNFSQIQADKVYQLPFDSGCAYGRNYLVQQVETPYIFFLDDDCIFTTSNQLEKFLYVIQEYNLDIVSGFWEKSPISKLKIEKNNITRVFWDISVVDKIPYADLVPQFFIAKTQTLLDYPWDNDFKTEEHLPFFIQAKNNNLKCSFIKSCTFDNQRYKEENYNKYRWDRKKDYINLQKKKFNVSQIQNSNKFKIDYLNKKLKNVAKDFY